MDVQSLVEYIYEDNRQDCNIFLVVNSIEKSEELFAFLVSLSIHGFIKMCGNGVQIENIPVSAILQVQQKLRNIGIALKLTFHTPDRPNEVSTIELRMKPKVNTIEDMALFLHCQIATYVLTFSFIRKQLKETCHYI
jgi:hypothetical protein